MTTSCCHCWPSTALTWAWTSVNILGEFFYACDLQEPNHTSNRFHQDLSPILYGPACYGMPLSSVMLSCRSLFVKKHDDQILHTLLCLPALRPAFAGCMFTHVDDVLQRACLVNLLVVIELTDDVITHKRNFSCCFPDRKQIPRVTNFYLLGTSPTCFVIHVLSYLSVRWWNHSCIFNCEYMFVVEDSASISRCLLLGNRLSLHVLAWSLISWFSAPHRPMIWQPSSVVASTGRMRAVLRTLHVRMYMYMTCM